MRFSYATILLVATALAAPIHEVDEVDQRKAASQYRSLAIRESLFSILPRIAPVSLKPVPKVPVHGDPVINGPDPAPLSPKTDPAGNPTEGDAPVRMNPDDPVANPTEGDAPVRMNPDDPNAPKPVPVDGCLRKRGCTPLPGADQSVGVDQKYNRVLAKDATAPTGQYLVDAGVAGGTGNKWTRLSTSNDDAILADFDPAGADAWQKDLVDNQGWDQYKARDFVEEQKANLMKPGGAHDDFMVTSHNPKKGFSVAETSYNGEFDLRREFKGTAEDYDNMPYKRPAQGDGKSNSWGQMFMDDMRVAYKADKKLPSDLRSVGRHNIETPNVQVKLKGIMDNTPGTKTFTEANTAEWATIKTTLHAKTTDRMLSDNSVELKGLKAKSYTVIYGADERVDMIINVEP
jgi:hypothetical protein